MLAKSLAVLCVITMSLGASVKSDISEIEALITKKVTDILKEERNKESERTETILTEIKALKELNTRMEKRIEFLEQENADRDLIICFLNNQTNGLLEKVTDDNKARNDSLNNPTEFQYQKCKDIKNEDFVNNHNTPRRKRQIVPTQAASIPNIAFSAYLSSTNSHMSPGQAIKYDRVHLNDGAGYNSYTGAFTAPISGTYLFMFQFDSRVHTFVRLNVDGRNIVDAVTNPHVNTQDRENMSGNSAIIHVGVGQSVLVEVYDVSGEVASSDKYRLSTFCGTLLYPEIHH